MRILGIESSCDECAAAIVEDGRRVLSNIVATQIPFHAAYDGVVPEIASRKHTEWIGVVASRALARSLKTAAAFFPISSRRKFLSTRPTTGWFPR